MRVSLVIGMLGCLGVAGTAAAQRELSPTINVPWSNRPLDVHLQSEWRQPGTMRMVRFAYTTPYTPDTRAGAQTYMEWYQVSTDEGKTYGPLKQIVQSGPEYSPQHPLEPVVAGVNSFYAMLPPVQGSNGELFIPFYYWPLDEQGRLLQTTHLSFTRVGVLIARWNADQTDLTWNLGQTVGLSPQTQSTRGAMEPTIVELKTPGCFLMVLRGSNSRAPQLPGYKWKCLSSDNCRTWSRPEPLTYADGEHFFSPSSQSVIRRSPADGKIYWFGNLCDKNPDNDDPRDPLVVARLDESTLGLVKQSVTVLATRDPKIDTPEVEFSNFSVNEDPQSGDFIVTLMRIDQPKLPKGINVWKYNWPELRYVVKVDGESIRVE